VLQLTLVFGILALACSGLPISDPIPLPAGFELPASVAGSVRPVLGDAPPPKVSATQAEATASQHVGRHGPLVGLVRRVIVDEGGRTARGWLVVYRGALDPCVPDDPNAAAACTVTNVVAVDDEDGTVFAVFSSQMRVTP
jgi:hypothetical protein